MAPLAIRREKPGIVILDLNMPGLNGEAIARIVQDEGSCAFDRFPFSATVSVTLTSILTWFYAAGTEFDQLERIVQQTGALGAIQKGDPRRFVQAFEDLLAFQSKAR